MDVSAYGQSAASEGKNLRIPSIKNLGIQSPALDLSNTMNTSNDIF